MKKYNRQLNELEDSLRVRYTSYEFEVIFTYSADSQAKQLQIEDLLARVDGHQDEFERLRDEKDQEIAIMQEGLDTTIQQLADAQQVIIVIREILNLLSL